MATNIDERIVAAKFDASDFEKGVDKTCKKLDELKKSLDLKDAAKGVKELAEKTEASTDSMSKSLDKLTERFTTFFGMIKQKLLSGLADEVVGVFFKMEQGVKSFIKSISTDQVSVGMSKYEQMLASVRTMMAAGESEGAAYAAIGNLRDYSDQTSYSLSQMTDALSKLRAAGVDLDTATKSVEGIANACANAGINATDAQRAFFNLSQAYSSGTLKYTDYRSLELLNMTTEKFKENILEAAVSAGTLKKVSEGVYQTINKGNKKVTAGKKVTKQNLQDMLRYNFVTSEVMNELFGGTFFFDEQKFKEYKKKYATLDEAIAAAKKDYGETAVNAYLAAREARSFTDVVNTLKDVVSTGWSTTFEYLFGKLDDAKDFFTELAEGPLADVIYKIGEYRNAILEMWNGPNSGFGGGEVFRRTILNISDALGTLLRTFLEILPGFSELYKTEEELEKNGTPLIDSLGHNLFDLSMRIRDVSVSVKKAAEDFHSFMNEEAFKGGPSRIELLRTVFSNLLSVFTIAGKLIGIAFRGIGKAFQALHPIFDGLLIVLSKVTQPLMDLSNDSKIFNDLEYTIDNICTALSPVATFLGEILGFVSDIAGFIAQMALDTFTANITFFADTLGLIFELITGNSAQMKAGEGVLANMQKDFEGIKEACIEGYNALKEFFGVLLGDIRELFGLTEDANKQNQNGGLFSGLVNFFNTNEFVQKAKKWVNQAIVDVGEFIKSIPSRIRALGINIYTTLRGLFFTEEKVKNGDKEETKEILTPLGQWCDQAIKDIKAFIVSIPQRIIDGVGKVTNWINEVFDYWFGKRKSDQKHFESEGGKWVEKDTVLISRFDSFIIDARLAITKWFEDLPNKIQTAFANVGNFFTNLYNAIDEFLFGKKVRQTISVADGKGGLKYKDITVRYKSGFSKWLDGVIKDIKKFISNIPEYIKSGIRGAGDIITTIVAALFGKPEGDKVTNKDVSEELAAPFLGIDISALLNEIKNIGKEILNQIARIFTGTDDIDSNMNWFSEKIAEGINWIREKALAALTWLTDTLTNIPTTIANLFTGEKKDNPSGSPVGSAIVGFGETIGTFITVTLPDKILEFINNTREAFDKIWTTLYNTLVGDANDTTEKAAEEATDAMTDAAKEATDDNEIPSAWQNFVTKLGETLSKIWEDLPVWIANGIELAIAGVNDLISNVGNWIKDIGVGEEAEKAAEEQAEETVDAVAEGSEEGSEGEEPRLITAIKKIGERIKELFVAIIPGFISDAWTAISALGSDLYTGISKVFSGESTENDNERVQFVAGIGNKVVTWLTTDLPGYFHTSWDKLAEDAKNVFLGFKTVFTGDKPIGEVQEAANTLGTNIYKIFTETIPNFIKRAFDFISNLFKKKDPIQETLNSLPDSEKAYVSRYINKMQKDTKDVVKDAEQPGFFGFISGIGESLLEAFSDLGPTIINGLASALDWISSIVDFIINALTGEKSISEQVDDAYKGEKPELTNALKRIGESLKKFFLDTIPKFIGAAIGTLQREAPKWFANLFGAMTKAAEAEADQSKQDFKDQVEDQTEEDGKEIETAVQGATGVLGVVMDMFENLKKFVGDNKDILEIAVVLIALTTVLGALSDLFSVSRIGEAASDIVKWGAIALAITAIGGILSYITKIVDENDPEKIKNFEDILDKIVTMLRILGGITFFMNAGKIAESLAEMKTSGGGIAGSVLSLFGGIITGAGIGGGAYLAGLGLSGAIDSVTTTFIDSFVNLSSSIDDSVNMLSPVMDRLEEINTKIDTAKDTVTKIKELFAIFMSAFEELYSDATGNTMRETNNPNELEYETLDDNNERIDKGNDKARLSVESYIKVLQDRLDLFLQLSVFINEMASAFHKLHNVEDIGYEIDRLNEQLLSSGIDGKGGKLQSFFVNILNVLKTAVEGSNLSPELLGAQYTARISGISLALDLLADSLSVFGSGIANLNEDNVTAVGSMLDVFGKMAEAFGDAKDITDKPFWSKLFTGDTSLSKIGNEIKLFGIDMKAFYDYVVQTKGFEESEVKHTGRIVDGMVEVLGKIATVAKNVTDYSAGFMLNDMNQYLPTFGKSLGEFFTNINDNLSKNISSERLAQLTSMVGSISVVITAMTELARISMDRDNFDISSMFDAMFLGFGGEDQKKQNENINKLSTILILFNKAIQKSLLSEEAAKDYEEVGTVLAKRLFTGIQSALDSDPTLRITPVLNLDTAEQQLRSMFGVEDLKSLDFKQLYGAAAGSNDQVDEDRVKWSALSLKIDEVSGAINTLAEAQPTLNDLTNAFSKLKMYINKNTLVGEITDDIDYHIGLKINLLNGNITP